MSGLANSKWRRVTPRCPCPICSSPDWCCVSSDGAAAICMRVPEGAFRSKQAKNGSTFYLHRLTDDPRDIATPQQILRLPGAAADRERAAPDTLNAVYSQLLKVLTLSAHHHDALAKRGLDNAIIEKNGYRTMPARGRTKIATALHSQFGADLFRVPGVVHKQGTGGEYLTMCGPAGLIVPCRDTQGRIIALKVRRDDSAKPGPRYVYVSSAKYEGPSPGAPAHVPLGTAMCAGLVRLVEGELKADVVFALTGGPTISVAGVGSWRTAINTLRELGASTVRLAFDADARAKPEVAGALSRGAAGLREIGFQIELEHWDASEGKGLDDLLVGGGWPGLVQGEAVIPAIEDIANAAGYVERRSRPKILITTEEHDVNDQAVAALAADQNIYQRAGTLVRIIVDASPAANGLRRPFTPRIDPLPLPLLRERLAANAEWVKLDETQGECPARPPAWSTAAVHARGAWPGIRHLEAVVDHPVLRSDGRLLCSSGYDSDTGLLLRITEHLPELADRPSQAEAFAARNALLEVVADFPFEQEVHKSAWLAALLTPLGRFAFNGPAPLFLVDANVRGAGKGLLLDTVAHIVTGHRFPVATYSADQEELRKRITSLAVAGDRMVLFDNVEGYFGNPVLDAALTATSWEDRLLSTNRMVRAPLYLTWFATGNNVAIAADTARRTCHIRLECSNERPEQRSDFRHANLLAWVAHDRVRLLTAALTILRAYCAAGRPDMALTPWGSFEAWSHLIRGSVVWVGMADPGATRVLLQEKSDEGVQDMAIILDCWERMDPQRHGLTAAGVLDQLFRLESAPTPEYFPEFRAAIDGLINKREGRLLGNQLRKYRRRVINGRFIDHTGREHQAVRWAVFPANQFHDGAEQTPLTPQTPLRGESGESGESSDRQPESTT